jgi:hypothetical protein
MVDTITIEEENVVLRQALERAAFMCVGASCKDARCMHSACSVVRALEHNLKAFIDKKRPNEVVAYQDQIKKLKNKLSLIQGIVQEP